MSREKIESYIKTNTISMGIIYDYYIENNKNDIYNFSGDDFFQYFNMYLRSRHPNYLSELLNDILYFFSVKYNLELPTKVFLLDEKGNLIKQLHDIQPKK